MKGCVLRIPRFSCESRRRHATYGNSGDGRRAWIAQGGRILTPDMHTGSGTVVHELERWFTRGALSLQSVAAGEIVRELSDPNLLLLDGAAFSPFCLPEDTAPGDVPRNARVLLAAGEGFRATTLKAMGDSWMSAMPKIPLANAELKGLILR